MTLSDGVNVGDQVMFTPAWEHNEHGALAPAQPARVIYVHPGGRYYTIMYKNGLTDTVQTAPAERLAHKETKEEVSRRLPNKHVKDVLKSLHVRQKDASKYMGHSSSWLSHRLVQPLSKAEQVEILQAAEKMAAERSAT